MRELVKVPNIERKCSRCKKPQPVDEDKSNENWKVYDMKATCSCGEKFQIFINGEPIGGGD